MSKPVLHLSVHELKKTDRRSFEREYSKWTEWQWEDDWYVENAKEIFTEKYKPKGIEIEQLHYSISFSQGDYASFSGRVFLSYWMETVQIAPDGPTYAERYPALYLACREDGSYMNIHGEDDRRGWRCDYQEGWYNTPPSGIFANLSDDDWEDLVNEQAGEADLETEILGYCRSIGRELYDHLSDAYMEATSEEAFIESCEANGITFEVEIEDEVFA